MASSTSRRGFLKGSLMTPAAAAALALKSQTTQAKAEEQPGAPSPAPDYPHGKIGDLEISRLLLGGNLLTHYTHSRDLKYVYNLAAHYNTEEKILETLALAESRGINTLSVHTVPTCLDILKKHRYKRGGKMQWIICPTAEIDDKMEAYSEQVKALVDDGTDAIYLWGVRADPLAAQGRTDLIAKAVEIAKDHGVPSGVGAHDLNVILECEKHDVGADFYIKTFHHHRYPTGPKPNELSQPYNEFPGYWCQDPEAVIQTMAKVEKPWIAFKIMAAGAIPPDDAVPYAFNNGADHVLMGMFDFEIAADAELVKKTIASVQRQRPWYS